MPQRRSANLHRVLMPFTLEQFTPAHSQRIIRTIRSTGVHSGFNDNSRNHHGFDEARLVDCGLRSQFSRRSRAEHHTIQPVLKAGRLKSSVYKYPLFSDAKLLRTIECVSCFAEGCACSLDLRREMHGLTSRPRQPLTAGRSIMNCL
jgi:hypothetical protein